MDEDALLCDFAEVYHLFNYRALPPKYAAALFVGLDEESRIKRKLSGCPVSTQTALLAIIADRLGLLVWQSTEDGHRGTNKPNSIFDAIMRGNEESELCGYETGTDFDAAREKVLNGEEG